MTVEATSPSHPAASAEARALARGSVRSEAAGLWPIVAWAGLGVLVAAGVLLFWVFDAIPFMDLPAHAGLIALRHRFASSPFEQQLYVLAPHIGPYSLFRFLGDLFVSVLTPVGAVRALGTLPVLATPLAMLFARRRLYGDRSPVFGFYGVLLSFGLMTLFGFASYLLGIAVMLVALTLWLELMEEADRAPPAEGAADKRGATRREVLVLLVTPLVFVAHGHAFLLFLLLAGVTALATGNRWQRALRIRALVPSLALAGYVAWEERAAAIPAGSVAIETHFVPLFQSAYDKFTLMVTPTLMTRNGVDFAAAVVLWMLVTGGIVCTFRALRRVKASGASPVLPSDDARARHTVALLAAMGVTTVVFLVLPHQVGWFGFVDGRLLPVVLMLGLLSIRLDALGRRFLSLFEKLGGVLAAAVLVSAFVASVRFQDEARGYKEVLAAVPTYARLLNLPLDPNSDVFTGHPFVHYDKFALAERPVVVSDVWFHQGTALYPRPSNPALHLPAEYQSSDVHSVAWSDYPLNDWDYVLIRTRPSANAPEVPSSLALTLHRGGWWLYRSTRS